MNKQEILEYIIGQLTDRVKGLEESTEDRRTIAREAEGRNQSRYDSVKIEQSYLANALSMRAGEAQKDLEAALKFKLPLNPMAVVVGSIVTVSYTAGDDNYFILPFLGGLGMQRNQQELTIISPQAPITKKMLGLKVGQEFEFNRDVYKIKILE